MALSLVELLYYIPWKHFYEISGNNLPHARWYYSVGRFEDVSSSKLTAVIAKSAVCLPGTCSTTIQVKSLSILSDYSSRSSSGLQQVECTPYYRRCLDSHRWCLQEHLGQSKNVLLVLGGGMRLLLLHSQPSFPIVAVYGPAGQIKRVSVTCFCWTLWHDSRQNSIFRH